MRHAPPPPPRDVPARPIEDRPPDPPARKDDDDDPPSSSAAFRARYGRYPTGYEVMKLGIKCFQAVDLEVPVSQPRNEYLSRAQRGEGGPKDRVGKGHIRHAAVCSPPPSAPHPELVEGRPPSPQAGKVLMRGEQTRASRETNEEAKPGLGRTLVRLYRAGIDAVLGRPRAGESIDGVSHVSHAVHRMPILRAFWRGERGGDERQTETKQAPMAMFPHKTCLISGLRLSGERVASASAMPA